MSKKDDKNRKRQAKAELKHNKKFRKMLRKDLKSRVAAQDQLDYAVSLLQRMTEIMAPDGLIPRALDEELVNFLTAGEVPESFLVMKYEGRDGKTVIQEPELTSVLGDQGERPDDVPMTQPDLRPTGRTGQTSHPDWREGD